MKTAVSQMIKELQEKFPKEMGDMYERNQLLLEDIALRAKEMEKEQNEKYNELKEVIEDMIKHLDEGIHLTLRKDSIIVEALRNSINKK
jgi:hypothetical protein